MYKWSLDDMIRFLLESKTRGFSLRDYEVDHRRELPYDLADISWDDPTIWAPGSEAIDLKIRLEK
jgi:hypothetical protein